MVPVQMDKENYLQISTHVNRSELDILTPQAFGSYCQSGLLCEETSALSLNGNMLTLSLLLESTQNFEISCDSSNFSMLPTLVFPCGEFFPHQGFLMLPKLVATCAINQA